MRAPQLLIILFVFIVCSLNAEEAYQTNFTMPYTPIGFITFSDAALSHNVEVLVTHINGKGIKLYGLGLSYIPRYEYKAFALNFLAGLYTFNGGLKGNEMSLIGYEIMPALEYKLIETEKISLRPYLGFDYSISSIKYVIKGVPLNSDLNTYYFDVELKIISSLYGPLIGASADYHIDDNYLLNLNFIFKILSGKGEAKNKTNKEEYDSFNSKYGITIYRSYLLCAELYSKGLNAAIALNYQYSIKTKELNPLHQLAIGIKKGF